MRNKFLMHYQQDLPSTRQHRTPSPSFTRHAPGCKLSLTMPHVCLEQHSPVMGPPGEEGMVAFEPNDAASVKLKKSGLNV
jgi:hypothetical protein